MARPHSWPQRISPEFDAELVELRTTRELGPARIGMILDMPTSTVGRVLVRHGLNRLSWMDRPTGRVIRRDERSTPGELVHIDIKKLGCIPDDGGWRVHGRGYDGHYSIERPKPGYADVRQPVGSVDSSIQWVFRVSPGVDGEKTNCGT